MPTFGLEHLRSFFDANGDEPVDEFGMPMRVHYSLVGLIAFFVGAITLVFALTPGGAPLRHPVVVSICLAGMSVPVLYGLVARRREYEFNESLITIVLLLGVLGPFICHFFIGDLPPAFITLYMLGPIGAAYYAPLSRSWPVIALGTAAILIVSARIDEPDAMMRGAICATITVASSLMLSAIHGHLSQTVESNREISERDPLTGASNMHTFDERLDEEIAESSRGGYGFAIVEFDLDDFRAVNDVYGHAVGDEVLIASAEAIQSVLLPGDLLVRRGGDEFIVIAPVRAERNLHAMTLLARDRIASVRRSLCPDLTSTACAGWALHDHHESAASVIQRADDVLQDSKRAATLRSDESIVWRDLRESQSPDRLSAPATAEVLELRRRRAEEAAIGENPMHGAMKIGWNTAAFTAIVLSAVLFVMGITGQLSFKLDWQEYALFILWAGVLAPIAFWVTHRRSTPFLDHMLSVMTIVLITLTCLAIGSAAPAAVEIYMMGSLLYLIILPFRWAAVYVAISFGLYATFLFAHDYPHSDIRITMTLINFGIIGTIIALTRHTAIEAADEKAVLARTDALTGLPNMRRLRDWIEDEIAHCEESGGSIALLTLDLDDFKAVNDLHGHETGDAVLVAVAGLLRQTARESDLAARRGGDEFVLGIADSGARDAELTAWRIAENVKFLRAKINPDITPTTSIGWVLWNSGDSVDDLLNRSDDALHEEKLMAREDRCDEAEIA